MKPPLWISSYNFMCLPKGTNVIQKYGPLGNLWEGSLMGEKILSLTKDIFLDLTKIGAKIYWKNEQKFGIGEGSGFKKW